jgi:predicted DNA-binding ribbon-helix-helix protein
MLEKRSLSLAGHRTSIALEPDFWVVLAAIATERAMPLTRLIADIDAIRAPEQKLASALRVFALRHRPV